MLTITSEGGRLCDGWNRREVLRAGEVVQHLLQSDRFSCRIDLVRRRLLDTQQWNAQYERKRYH